METTGKSVKSQGKHCENCGKEFLFGRADRRFCNDGCRNTFSRNKRAQEQIRQHENLPEIFRIIKKNYEILKANCNQAMHPDETVFMDAKELLKTGFNPKFFTSVHTTSKSETWYCCFECCFQIGEQYAFFKHCPEQAVV